MQQYIFPSRIWAFLWEWTKKANNGQHYGRSYHLPLVLRLNVGEVSTRRFKQPIKRSLLLTYQQRRTVLVFVRLSPRLTFSNTSLIHQSVFSSSKDKELLLLVFIESVLLLETWADSPL